MQIELKVTIDGRFWQGGASVKVPELLHETFEPLKTTDDAMLASALGEKCLSEEIKKVLALRNDAAKILSRRLTEMILAEMSKNDTHNGYKKTRGMT